MHDLPWKYFWSQMRWFFLWFARVMGSQVKFTGKSHHKRLKSLFTVTNALFYFLHFTLWPEHTIPLTKDHRSLIPPLLPRVVYSDLTLWRHNSWCDAMNYSHPTMGHILYIRYGIYSPIFASKYKYEFKQGGGGASAQNWRIRIWITVCHLSEWLMVYSCKQWDLSTDPWTWNSSHDAIIPHSHAPVSYMKFMKLFTIINMCIP